MSTINELMTVKQPGSTLIRAKGWPPARWFRPFYLAGGCWYGPGFVSDDESYRYSGYDWELYAEPVEMVDKWKFCRKDDGYEYANFYESEEELRKNTSAEGPFMKLEYTKTSFPKEKK